MKYNSFIAANSSKGFFSFFDELVNDLTLTKVYLIKGGPGCGKSTFMKKISSKFSLEGYTIEQILCSSDPESLDGIIIKEKNIAIIDATSPHAYDLKYAGAFDSIIDLSEFWDEKLLIEKREGIIPLTQIISERYKKVYGVLKSAGIMFNQIIELSDIYIENEKIIQYVKKTIKQNAFTPTGSKAKITHRFLNSISHKGIYYCCSPIDLCKKAIILEDEPLISHEIIFKFASYFNKCGYDMTLFHNPLCPSLKIDHLIVPQLEFGVFSTNSVFEYKADENSNEIKSVNAKNFINKEIYSENKNKIGFYKKITKALLETVICDLSEIKTMHDSLEKYYINAMNYESLDKFTDNFIDKMQKIYC